MRNSDGKAAVTMVVLGALILLALVPWILIVTNMAGLDFDFNIFGGGDEEEAPYYMSDSENEPLADDAEGEDEPDEEIYDETDDEPELALDLSPDENAPVSNVEMTVAQISSEHNDLYSELREIASEHNAVAVGLVAFDGNRGDFYTFGFGFADREATRRVSDDTRFRVASLAKLVTTITVMTLYDEGLIDLDTDISNYFGFEVRNVHFPGTPITVRMLMQHTSSLFDSGAFQVSRDRGSSESVRFLIERGSSFRRNEPGSTFEYSNFGYSVLSALAERVTGMTIDTLAREVIFEPLGIDAAYVAENLEDTGNIAVIYNDRHSVSRTVESQLNVRETGTPGHDLHLAQGNLYITILDYARILAMLGNGGSLDGVRILSTNAVREMHITDVQGVAYEQGLATRFSFGEFIDGEGFFWHTGSAYGTFAQYVYCLERNQGVVVVTTGASISRLANGMIDICTEMSRVALRVFDQDVADDEEEYDDEGV